MFCRKEYYRANRSKMIANVQRSRRARYGWPPGRYEKVLELQDGRCAICGELPKIRQLAADHHHETLQPRALLCWKCNTSVGWEESQSEYKKKVLAYIRDWEAQRA